MADEQIRFYFKNKSNENDNLENGAVIFTPKSEDQNEKEANLYFKYGGREYQIKPSYTLEELNVETYINDYFEKNLATTFATALSNYVDIERIDDDSTTTLKISVSDGSSFVTSDGNFITTEEITPSKANRPGTFMVGERVIPVVGLFDTTELNEEYTSLYPTSKWIDLTKEEEVTSNA